MTEVPDTHSSRRCGSMFRRAIGVVLLLYVLIQASSAIAAQGWIPLPDIWLQRGKQLPEAAVGAEELRGSRFAMAEHDAFLCTVGLEKKTAWAAEVSGTEPGSVPTLSGGRASNDTLSLEAPGGLWLKVTGGTYHAVNGGNFSDWDNGRNFSKNLIGDSCIYLSGTTYIKTHVSGGDYKIAGRPVTVGDAAVVIDGEARVRGSIFGAGAMLHSGYPRMTGDTDVVIGNVQPDGGRVVGSFGWVYNGQSHALQSGNSRVLVRIAPEPGEDAPRDFGKELFGGPLVGLGSDEALLSGNASVTVDAPGVRFRQVICGGGGACLLEPVRSRVSGDTHVLLKAGRFEGVLCAGGYPGNTQVDGRSVLELQGGTYEGARLLGGNTSEAVLRISGRDVDLSRIGSIRGFRWIELADASVRLTVRAEDLRPGMSVHLGGGTLRVRISESDADAAAYILPAITEGNGTVLAVFDNGRSVPLEGNRSYIPKDGASCRQWLLKTGNNGALPADTPPKLRVLVLNATRLTGDADALLPAGSYDRVLVLGNERHMLSLRLAPGASVRQFRLYARARLRLFADKDTDWTFGVTGDGVLVKAGLGRATLRRSINLDRPGYVCVEAGTLAYGQDADGESAVINGDGWVAGGATLDFAGIPDGATRAVMLEDGAVLANDSDQPIGIPHRQLEKLELLGDAEVRSMRSFGLVGAQWRSTELRLNGHTLTKTGPWDFWLVSTVLASGGTLDIREGTVTAAGGGTESHLNGPLTLRVAKAADFRVDSCTVSAQGAVTLAPEGVLRVSARLNGSELLRIVSGTVKPEHPRQYRTGPVLIDAGAVLDLTDSETEIIREDRQDWGLGYVMGQAGHVTVRGTLRTRSIAYNQALGGLAHQSDRLLLDGGMLMFAGDGSFDEAYNSFTRGFTISEKGAVLALPAGRSYTKTAYPEADIVNRGELRLKAYGEGKAAVFRIHSALAGTVRIGAGCLLTGNGSATHLVFDDGAVIGLGGDMPPKTVTGCAELPKHLILSVPSMPDSADALPALLTLTNAAELLNADTCEAVLTDGQSSRPVRLSVCTIGNSRILRADF